MLQLIFYFSLFLFFLVSNSLAYITITQNKGNKKLTEINCNIYTVSLINVCFFFFFAASLLSMSQGKLSAMLNISCRRNGQTVPLRWILHRL